jgi:hypothetical protein
MCVGISNPHSAFVSSAAHDLQRHGAMKPCETCGNVYDKAFEVKIGGTTHTFDSFACAIQMLAPRCNHCKVAIISQGMEARGQYFCCAACARQVGIDELADRAPDSGEARP